MSKVPGGLWKSLIAVQVYGANTGVGKTVASTLLAKHFLQRQAGWNVHYIKPVSTGPDDDADEKYLRRYGPRHASVLFQFKKPVSPHIAAREEQFIPSDQHVIQRLVAKLNADAHGAKNRASWAFTIVETAGGVLSPGPSGTPQADIFRPIRLPAVLVGDHRLGGIATTISAAESLTIRGYDIDAVICFDDGQGLGNAEYLKGYFNTQGISTFVLPWIPNLRGSSMEEEYQVMSDYYENRVRQDVMQSLAVQLKARHGQRCEEMDTMADRTSKAIWHPFTQHKSISSPDDILVFDSAYGDYFQVKHTPKSVATDKENTEASLLHPAFDGSASWWTQGLGHGNPKLSLAAAYSAGRYGHIMFAGATHAPALTLAERLLGGMNNLRLSKVFYTDNGSTATEVGVKMALRAACKRYDWDGSREDVDVIGLKGSYHGDTIGAMDASEPCVYNKKVDWYRGRGYWFDYPTVKMKDGMWVVRPPPGMEEEFGPTQKFGKLDDIFDTDSRGFSPRHEAYIRSVLDKLVVEQGRKFGALIMEPIILGAGGMIFVDPLFQRTLVEVVRTYPFFTTTPPSADPKPKSIDWTGVPVIFDEVFTGLYRLGRFSAASLLGVHPDISCHAKLLTGGLLPLSTTLASESIFDAFWGDEKADALLHGHSYTAHPIGCHVANTALQEMERLSTGSTWRTYQASWVTERSATSESTSFAIQPRPLDQTWSMWTRDTVLRLSHDHCVSGVIALGSVLAITLKDKSGTGGYTSNAAAGLRDALLNDEKGPGGSVHSRVLGNVIYLMASMSSKPQDLRSVEVRLMSKLKDISGARKKT
ncbi:PLP-dependent transferase [Lophiostoma macrostomum CBS 122681]|uniref:PLP-dependent transferase n=1 Tax=Lophiostoma macrostomum CBS 122681 TaxID=1314788 RepID=A0A6A6SYZ6_9PLEO|nr:PLP-dependent transferase [Lophiostoma macrostomum CBS 122681]